MDDSREQSGRDSGHFATIQTAAQRHPTERPGEVVFLTGYQEVFTDPSYSGQIVILTNPQIGNYGTSVEDNESAKPYIEGLVVREFSERVSNWRSDQGADSFLAKNQIPIISEIDT